MARQRAHREFGNATRFQEASHDLFSFRLLEDFVQDLRYAAREMRRSAGVHLHCGVIAGRWHRRRHHRLCRRRRLHASRAAGSRPGAAGRFVDRRPLNLGQLALRGFCAVARFVRWALRGRGQHRRESHDAPLGGQRQTGRRPRQPRVRQLLSGDGRGRGARKGLSDTDAAAPGAAAVAVISDAFWKRWFGGAPDVLAKTIDLHGRQLRSGGCRAEGVHGTFRRPSIRRVDSAHDAAGADARCAADVRRSLGHGTPVAEGHRPVGTGVSVEQATASARLVHQRFVAEKADALGESHPQVAGERKVVVSMLTATTGYAPERARYARPLMILSAITALVLLVACANFTNLMLARSEGRRREFVIRLALGGGTWRLIRQSATECVVLAIVAGLLGLLLASWATALTLKQFAVMITPVEFALELNARVLAFAGACVAVVIAFGLWPCTRPARSAAVSSVCQSTKPAGRASTRAIAGRVMLVVQLAMCTILMIGAGLLLRTVTNLRSQELGFDRKALLVSVSPRQAGYSNEAAAMLLQRSVSGYWPCRAYRPLACRACRCSTTPPTGSTGARC